MYAAYFGLREQPFNNTPDPRFFRATPDHDEALACLIYAVQERKGFVLLTGEVGAGKTLVVRMMLRHFGNRVASAVITNTAMGPDDLLAAICSELGVETPPSASRFDRVSALQDYLVAEFAADRPVVLVVDEAQNLSDEAFEQIRMIGNLEADNAKLLQIVIVGQPELRERLAARHLWQLRQRVFRGCHLPALSRQACDDYVRHRLAVAKAGSAPSDRGVDGIFDDDALGAVYIHGRGLPRLINTLCDNAMLCAFAADRRTIDGAFLSDVIQQLDDPPPCGHEGARPAADAPVEPAVADTGTSVVGPENVCEQAFVDPSRDGEGADVATATNGFLTGAALITAAHTYSNSQPAPDSEAPPDPGDESAPMQEQPSDDNLDDDRYGLAEVSARARLSVARVGEIYAAADQTYCHLIHHLADIQRPSPPLRQPFASVVPSNAEGAHGALPFEALLGRSRSSLDRLRRLVDRTNVWAVCQPAHRTES